MRLMLREARRSISSFATSMCHSVRLGEEQSRTLGHWFAEMPPSERPDVVLSSPYLRARQTADIIKTAGGLAAGFSRFIIDERLREKEFGILDRLTQLGIEQRHAQQAELRRSLGKFYHRLPGGESWCDVILRLRSVLTRSACTTAGSAFLWSDTRSSFFACATSSKTWTRKLFLKSTRRGTWPTVL